MVEEPTDCPLSKFSVLSRSAFCRCNKMSKACEFTKKRGSDHFVVVEAGKFSVMGSASAPLLVRAFPLCQQYDAAESIAQW